VARELLLPCAQRQMVSRFPPILPLSRSAFARARQVVATDLLRARRPP
jgi:hypothetical protein